MTKKPNNINSDIVVIGICCIFQIKITSALKIENLLARVLARDKRVIFIIQ